MGECLCSLPPSKLWAQTIIYLFSILSAWYGVWHIVRNQKIIIGFIASAFQECQRYLKDEIVAMRWKEWRLTWVRILGWTAIPFSGVSKWPGNAMNEPKSLWFGIRCCFQCSLDYLQFSWREISLLLKNVPLLFHDPGTLLPSPAF